MVIVECLFAAWGTLVAAVCGTRYACWRRENGLPSPYKKGTLCPPYPAHVLRVLDTIFFQKTYRWVAVVEAVWQVDKLWHSLGGSFFFALEAATPCLSNLTTLYSVAPPV
jgi:hypothetical protein